MKRDCYSITFRSREGHLSGFLNNAATTPILPKKRALSLMNLSSFLPLLHSIISLSSLSDTRHSQITHKLTPSPFPLQFLYSSTTQHYPDYPCQSVPGWKSYSLCPALKIMSNNTSWMIYLNCSVAAFFLARLSDCSPKVSEQAVQVEALARGEEKQSGIPDHPSKILLVICSS